LRQRHLGSKRPALAPGKGDTLSGPYLGPAFSSDEIADRLSAAGARFTSFDDDTLLDRTVDRLDRGDAVGWFQVRMEFGPRALGNRSILGDPRKPDMQKKLSPKIKFRESFRPFAPSVRTEDAADYFEIDEPSPYMLMVADVKRNRRRHLTEEQKELFGIDKLNVPPSDIPAATPVDNSARIQTVHAETNARYHALI
jgi:carbamoyltransferase